MYKSEIVRSVPGLSIDDFRKWMKIPKHKQALLELGVKPTTHKIPPKAVQYIFENYIK